MSKIPNIDIPENATVLRYIHWGRTRAFIHPIFLLFLIGNFIMFFVRGFKFLPKLRGTDGFPEDLKRGHPETADRIWELANALPDECRFYVYGMPTLIHPKSGVIFAFSASIPYCLRLPENVRKVAIAAGASNRCFSDPSTDTQRDLGADWIFAKHNPGELRWIQEAYKTYGATD